MREQLKKEAAKFRGGRTIQIDWETVSYMADLIARQDAYIDGLGWIKVEDALPEPGDYSVLACWNHGGWDMVHVGRYFEDITSGFDGEGNQLYEKYYISSGITHWKYVELPEQLTKRES